MAKLVAEVTIRGKLSYAKILGTPVVNYNKDGREWKLDLELTSDAAVKELKGYGVDIKQRENYLDGAPYITLKQAEKKADGSDNRPPRVVEIDGKTQWDETKLIGNETVADVKIAIMDNGPGKRQSKYIRGVRILEHVPYESTEFAPLSEDDEYFAGGSTPEDKEETPETPAKKSSKGKPQLSDELDDDIPFD